MLQPYDVSQIDFLFIRSCNFNWIAGVSGASSFVHSRDSVFGRTWLTWLSEKTSSLSNWLFFALVQIGKVKWVCFTLIEG